MLSAFTSFSRRSLSSLLIVLLFLFSHNLSFAQSVTAPAARQFAANTANQDASGFVLQGFNASDVLLASVGLVNPPAGTSLKIGTTTGLTLSTGYTSWTGFTRLSFTGTMANVNAALASLQVSTGAVLADLKISVSATVNPAGYFYLPSNGHFYQPVSWPSTGASGGASVYTTIKNNAAASSFRGQQGYLVTITNQDEQNFINANVPGSNILIALTDQVTEGEYKWDAGPEAGTTIRSGTTNVVGQYNNWCGGEPNNWGSGENYVVTKWNGGNCWNDYGPPATNFPGSISGYVIEYGTWSDPDNQTFTNFYSSSVTNSICNIIAATPRQYILNTANQDASGFVLQGFNASDVLLASVGLVNPPAGTSLNIGTTTGLTLSTGYTSWTGFTRLSFTGTMANINAALASLQVSTGSNSGNIKISVTGTINPAGYFYLPPNGHFYQPVSWPSTGASGGASVYTTIKNNAAASSFRGQQGYLVTITNQDEQNFINANVPGSNILIALTDQVTEGEYKWDAGPEAGTTIRSGTTNVVGQYNNWCGGEPNNWGSGENYVVTKWNGGNCWNDYGPPATNFPGSISGYVIEYGTWSDPDNQTFSSVLSNSTVNTSCGSAGTLSGTQATCTQQTTTFTSTVSGGSWTSSNTSIATVDATSGVVTGVAAGTATITYTVAGACAPVTRTVTVSTSPTVATVNNQIVTGNLSTTIVNFQQSSSNSGYQWMTINSVSSAAASGTGQNGITFSISQSGGGMGPQSGMYESYRFPSTYNIPASPLTTIRNTAAGVFTVVFSQPVTNPLVAFASVGNPGTPVPVVVSSNFTPIWTDNTPGWGTTYDLPNRTFTGREGFNIIRIDGTVTTVTFNYTVAEFYCTMAFGFEDQNVSFNWTNDQPSIGLAATGTGNILPFTAINNGSSPIVSTIAVTPVSTNGCSGTPRTFTITVNPSIVPGTITGNQAICVAGTSQFTTDGTSGGTWTSSNNTIATVSSSGLVTGVSAGTATITYTIGGQSSTRTITVTTPANAGTLAGTQAFCVAGTSLFSSNGNTGGVWTSSATGVATVSSTGLVTGVSAGTATITYTVTGTGGCANAVASRTVTVNPQVVISPISSQVINTGSPTTAVVFASTVSGTTFNWTNSNVNIVPIAAGSGNIASFITSNTGVGPISSTLSVTGTATSNGLTCGSAPVSFTMTVNPAAVVTQPVDMVVCTDAAVSPAAFATTNTGGTVTYAWTNNNTAIGLAASGTGNLPAFTSTNTTTSALVATITVTPTYTSGGVSNTGLSKSFTITVLPAPTINTVANQIVCAGTAATVSFGGTISGTTYTWSNSNTSIGIPANGTGNISYTPANTGSGPISATISVTPSVSQSGLTCSGGTISFTTTVNPSGQVNAINNQVLCNGSTTVAATLSTTNNSTSIVGTQNAGSGTISVSVPDASAVGATSTIPVTLPAGAIITNMRVTLNMTHTWISDMVINLRAPNGQILNLFNGHGANGDDLVNTVISSTGTASLASGTAPFTGTFAATAAIGVGPTGNASTAANFAALYGTPNGNWVLALRDLFGGDLGTLTGWNLSFDYTIPVNFTTFNWTNSVTSIGLAASGTGNVPSFTAVNTGSAPVVSTVTVTPVFNSGGLGCAGTPVTYTYTVNPTATVNAVANQTFCAGAASTVAFSGNATGTVYSWTNTNTAIGLPASGTGNLSFTPTNTTNLPIEASITVTPSFSNAGVTCTGSPRTFTITVNPVGQVNTVLDQVICNSSSTTPVNFATVNGGGTVVAGTPVTVNSGALTVAVPDASAIGVTHSLPVTLPAGATITGVSVNFNMTHTWVSDMVINLRAPNGQILNLVNRRGGSGDNFTNTTISSASTTSLATGSAPFTGTFAADAAAAVGPTSFVSAATNFAALYSVANGDWTLGMRDYAGGDLGTLTGWSITFNYTTVQGAATTYTWTNNLPSIGLAASGVGNIASFAAVNTSAVPVTATVTVTPTYTNSGVSCAGPASSFNYTVNPTPTVASVSNQAVCVGSNVAAVSFAGTVSGTVYNWTNSNTAIGLAASGTGNIASFVGTNTGAAPISGTITVTPVATINGVTCTGTPRTFTITVNPIPTVNPVNSFPVCHNNTAAVTFSGATTGTVYSWSNSTTSIGLAASGTGNISFTALNTTSAPVVATIRVTPSYTNGGTTCTGTPTTFTITVNPLPVVSAGTLPARICLSDTLVPLNGTPVGGSWSGIGTSGMNFVPTATAVGTWPITYTFSDINGCTNRATIAATVLACEERDRDLDNSAILLYPNPNNGQFNLRVNSTRFNALGMRVFNTAGQLVSVKQWSGLVYARVIPVNLSGLPAGIYMVRLYYGDGMDRGADKTYQVIIAR